MLNMTRREKAFTLPEMLITIAVLAVLASVAVMAVNGVYSSAKNQKLQADVDALNRSVKAFVVAGGDLSALTQPADVLMVLKQYSAFAVRTPGFGGSKIDPRITFRFQTETQSATDQVRAYWDVTSSSFILTNKGAQPGIIEFLLDETLAEVDYGTSNANTAFLYAKEDTWVWDYQDASAGPAAPPDEGDCPAVTGVPGKGADGVDAASGSTGVRSSSEKLPRGPLKRSDEVPPCCWLAPVTMRSAVS